MRNLLLLREPGSDSFNSNFIIKKYCNYIKCGQYIEELSTNENIQYGVKLASSNQNIYQIKGES